MQRFGQGAIRFLAKERNHLGRHDRAHVVHLPQRIDVGGEQGVQRAVPRRQRLRRGLAHFANAERVDEAGERGLLARLQSREQVLGGFGAHALKPFQLRLRDAVQARWIGNQAAAHQLLHQLVPQAFDVERKARREVPDALLALRGALRTGPATGHHLAFGAFDRCPAGGTLGGHPHRRRGRRALGLHDLCDLRNDVAGAVNEHGVADAQIQPLDLVHVVQGGVGDRHAAHEHRLQLRHRRDGAGAADLEVDVPHHRAGLLGRILVGDGPTRLARDLAETLAQPEVVHFHHRPVDGVAEGVALGEQRPNVAGATIQIRLPSAARIDGKAKGRERLHHLGVALHRPIRMIAGAVAEHGERTRRGDPRIQLSKAAGGAVAGVDDGSFAGLPRPLVELAKAVDGHVHLAPHLQQGRRRTGEPQRDCENRAHVAGDVFAGFAVAARGAARKGTVPIEEAHRHAVDLWFAEVGRRRRFVVRAQEPAATLFPSAQFLHARAFVERQHRRAVAHLLERIDRRRADALRGRVRGAQFRMFGLQSDQRVEQRVVFRIRDFGVVQGVVAVQVALDAPAQRRYPRARVLRVGLARRGREYRLALGLVHCGCPSFGGASCERNARTTVSFKTAC